MKTLWGKILLGIAALVVLLIAGSYLFVLLYDFDGLKPAIARAVFEATGRELRIEGHIDVKPALHPTLTAADVRFQNAPWGSRTDLATVKRIEVQMALLPMLSGEFDFVRVRLVEPDVILEKDASGTTNFEFESGGEGEAPWPILILRDARVENGVFAYRDADSGQTYKVAVDRLEAVIPGLDRSMDLDVEGRFRGTPFSAKGTAGPIVAWARPRTAFSVNLEVKSGESKAVIEGDIQNPAQFEDVSLAVLAEGPSLGEVAEQVGFPNIPNPGAFRVRARIEDPHGTWALRDVDIHVGSKDVVEVSIQGEIADLMGVRRVQLGFLAQGKDVAELTELGLPPPPRRGPFRVSGRITDREADVYGLEALQMAVGENEINGQLKLDLAAAPPRLTGRLHSNQFELGPFDTSFAVTGPVDKLAVESLHLEIGTLQTAKVILGGTIRDLRSLQGVDLDYQVAGEDLGNLSEIIGKPMPIRGPFQAAGKVSIPKHMQFQISHLKGTVGKTQLEGSLEVDLTAAKGRYTAGLFCRQMDPKEFLSAELAAEALTRLLENMDPVNVNIELSGYAGEFAIDRFDLTAGSDALARLQVEGTIQDPARRRGISVDFSVRGRSTANLQKLLGRPIPALGDYAVSGRLKDSGEQKIEISDLKIRLGNNVVAGRSDIVLEEGPAQISAELRSPHMDLSALADFKPEIFSGFRSLRDAGPAWLKGNLVQRDGRLSLQGLDFGAGKPEILLVSIKGAVADLRQKKGLDLLLSAEASDASSLCKLTGIELPLEGKFALLGRVTDPGAQNYRLSDLKIAHGNTTLNGWMMLEPTSPGPRVTADLSSPNLSLEGVNIRQLKAFARKRDLGPLKIRGTLLRSNDHFELHDLDVRLGRKAFGEVRIQGAVKGLPKNPTAQLDFELQGDDLAKLEAVGLPVSGIQGSFSASGRLVNQGSRVFKISPLAVRLGENEGKGWVEADLSGEHPALRADLSGDTIDVRPLLAKLGSKGGAEAEGVPSKGKAPRKRVFSAQPWDLSGLRGLNLDVAFRNRQLLLPRLALDDLAFHLVVRDGILKLKPVAVRTEDGSAEGWVELDSQKRTPSLSAELVVSELNIGSMLKRLDYEVTADGTLTGSLSLAGSGSSPAGFVAQLGGDIQLSMGEGKLAGRYLTVLQRYLGTNVIQLLNPLKWQAAYEKVNCFLVRIDIEDGFADCKMFLDTDQTTLTSLGSVDLKTEKIDFSLEPKPKGQGIRFSFKGLSRPFRLGGTLVNPSLTLDPEGTAFMLGQVAGAVLLGPAGIAAMFADLNLGGGNPCAGALQEAAKGVKAPTAEGTQKEEKTESPAGDAAAEQEKKGWQPGSVLKKIFRK